MYEPNVEPNVRQRMPAVHATAAMVREHERRLHHDGRIPTPNRQPLPAILFANQHVDDCPLGLPRHMVLGRRGPSGGTEGHRDHVRSRAIAPAAVATLVIIVIALFAWSNNHPPNKVLTVTGLVFDILAVLVFAFAALYEDPRLPRPDTYTALEGKRTLLQQGLSRQEGLLGITLAGVGFGLQAIGAWIAS